MVQEDLEYTGLQVQLEEQLLLVMTNLVLSLPLKVAKVVALRVLMEALVAAVAVTALPALPAVRATNSAAAVVASTAAMAVTTAVEVERLVEHPEQALD